MSKHIQTMLMRAARKSICKFRVSAAIVDVQGKCIAIGYNKPRFHRRGGGIHAEVDAIKRGGRYGAILYLMRLGRNGDKRPIEPCPQCRRLLNKLKIKIQLVD